jgi:regulatory protein
LADLRDRALRILQERDHSCQELRRKLLARGEPEEALDTLLQDLVRLGYLDDRRFAVQFVREKTRRGRGRLRLLEELAQRGIDRDLAGQILDEEDSGDEAERAEALARKRAGQGRSADSTARFLAGRGFAAATIRAVLRTVYQGG